MITNLPGTMALKPGSVSKPILGVQVALIDQGGEILEASGQGSLVILNSWPGQMRTVFGDHERFIKTYFTQQPGTFFTGDAARRDENGDYWITGRIDDVLNVSGHRIGTAEVESIINAHGKVAESAVVGFPHSIKGQGIYLYVILKAGEKPSTELEQELKQLARKK